MQAWYNSLVQKCHSLISTSQIPLVSNFFLHLTLAYLFRLIRTTGIVVKLFHSVLDQINKSLNNGTLYFPFVISLYALCNSVTYNKYSIRRKTACTLLIKDYANSLTNTWPLKVIKGIETNFFLKHYIWTFN